MKILNFRLGDDVDTFVKNFTVDANHAVNAITEIKINNAEKYWAQLSQVEKDTYAGGTEEEKFKSYEKEFYRDKAPAQNIAIIMKHTGKAILENYDLWNMIDNVSKKIIEQYNQHKHEYKDLQTTVNINAVSTNDKKRDTLDFQNYNISL